MADTGNVVINSFTETSEIIIGPNDISHVWMGDNLLWQKGGAGAEVWQPFVANDVFMVEYTPASTMTVESLSMTHDVTPPHYNYIVAIYAANQSKVFSQTGMSGVSVVTGDIVEGVNSYIHMVSFGGLGPTLTGGSTYYIGLGERYATYRTLVSTRDDSGAGASVKGWSLTNSTCQPFTSTSSNLYLKVVPL